MSTETPDWTADPWSLPPDPQPSTGTSSTSPAGPAEPPGILGRIDQGVQALQSLLEEPEDGPSKIDQIVDLLETVVENQRVLAETLGRLDLRLDALANGLTSTGTGSPASPSGHAN